MDNRKGYKEYYVAFVDILGFKNMISNATFDEILDIYWHFTNAGTSNPVNGLYYAVGNEIENEKDKRLKKFNEALAKTRYRYFSDCIVIAVQNESEEALAAVIEICNLLQESLYECSQPVFLRGAITKGPLYINNKQSILFGKGLVEAYQAENIMARYPRIIISEDVIRSGAVDVEDDCSNRVIKDEDGYWYVNSIGRYLDSTGDLKSAEKLKKYIEGTLNTYTSTDVRDKYLWLRKQIECFERNNGIIMV